MDDENSEALGSLKQKNGKPRRHLSVIRHCMSSVRLVAESELELVIGGIGAKSPSDGQSGSGFLPVFRSGSCSERGPKQYMEDEHICIDNLLEHLGESMDFPSPGAFYGVYGEVPHLCGEGH
ncbi:putative protein phosphatase 2C 27 [Tasmannia lanceolata]|uniref:putative protein phosphatase 2C 27 n=1 Tax=Tasmannia lanceolata TaxID=3420 RepID=UPI004064667A